MDDRDIIPAEVRERVQRTATDPRQVVLMMCGKAGSGKSTLAKAITRAFPSFVRLSVDQIIYERHGLYDTDYPPDKYEPYSAEARNILLDDFRGLLREGRRDVVLDRSFWAKRDRDAFKAIAEEAGARWVLVAFRARGTEVLWRRICGRRAAGAVDADSALDISEELLAYYDRVFEDPVGEGEIVIDVN